MSFEYKNKYLGVILTLCLFNRIVRIGLSSGSGSPDINFISEHTLYLLRLWFVNPISFVMLSHYLAYLNQKVPLLKHSGFRAG